MTGFIIWCIGILFSIGFCEDDEAKGFGKFACYLIFWPTMLGDYIRKMTHE